MTGSSEDRALMCLVSGGISPGSMSDHTEKTGTLQEKETQWLLGGVGKSDLVQAAFFFWIRRSTTTAGLLSLPNTHRR